MKLSLFLLTQDVDDFRSAMRDRFAEFAEVPTKPLEGVTLRLFVQRSNNRPPRWLRDLKSITDEDLATRLSNQFSSALLWLQRGDRRFIIGWGQAHHVVDRTRIEPGFGLKVTANAVASDGLLSADTRGLGRAKSQRTILPVASRLYELGIEPSEQWVRQLTGTARTAEFAGRISGADTLKLSMRDFNLTAIGEKLDEIGTYFTSTEYRKYFDFLDYFSRVGREQKALSASLWSLVQSRLDKRSDELEFAAPDALEPFDVSYYRFMVSGADVGEVADLSRPDVYACLDGLDNPFLPMEEVWVEAHDGSDAVIGESYRLPDYVVAEVEHNGQRYAVSAGAWFAIDADYVRTITGRISEIPELNGLMPAWRPDEDEGAYNIRVGAEKSWVVLDKDNFYIGGPYQKVEICDLLTADRQLICVKRMDASSTLSHLFAQGAVSTELLMVEDEYKAAVVNSLQKMAPTLEFDNATAWTIVYAVATAKPGPLSESLYFFSKVNLDRTRRLLRATGINVALTRIEKQSATATGATIGP